MASVKVVERLRVSPQPGVVPTTDLTLTYFDIIWLLISPNQRLLFYRYNGTTQDFRNSHFSMLQRSLSLTLTLFHPIAGKLVPLKENDTDDLVIRYSDGDSVPITLAESHADFDHLVGNHLKEVADLHPFVPELLPLSPEDPEAKRQRPLLAIQVTVFPFSGICIGITLDHVVADGSSATNFLRTWASICKSGSGDVSVAKNLPLYDHALLGDLEELKRKWTDDLKKFQLGSYSDQWIPKEHRLNRVLLGTFLLTRTHVEKLRNLLTSSGYDVGPRPSTYTITTAYVWVCATKAQGVRKGESVHFGFAVDCRSRLNPPVPATYFGNCIGASLVEASGNELTGENGFHVAAEAIHRTIQRMEEGGEYLKETIYWLPKIIRIGPERILSVASSPRFKVYEADFGWGRPEKVDLVSIEKTGAISLAESRDEEGGVQIGFVGPDVEMERFASIFEEGLKTLSSDSVLHV
ncbi:phenolic glucoside malonyltransferase 1-like [Aristolochia californica]|uniref:phenolic glucoside malonyltransferase 1-like n=1 Tax=Aristolochia californica TaxID=171875 RepID=UPI0035D541E2